MTNDPTRGGDNAPPLRITILGVGNLLLTDEGVGVHVAQALLSGLYPLPSEVEVIEGGTDGFGLLHIITATDYLIIIDAVKGGDEPGAIYRFDVADITTSVDTFKTSVHQISILEVLNFAELVGNKPETIIFGVEPESTSPSLELSPCIAAKLPRIIESVLAEIASLTT
ncbi:MAG: HyaD/HybD family hydrogenase maturation endopeptidase [bacterium]